MSKNDIPMLKMRFSWYMLLERWKKRKKIEREIENQTIDYAYQGIWRWMTNWFYANRSGSVRVIVSAFAMFNMAILIGWKINSNAYFISTICPITCRCLVLADWAFWFWCFGAKRAHAQWFGYPVHGISLTSSQLYIRHNSLKHQAVSFIAREFVMQSGYR